MAMMTEQQKFNRLVLDARERLERSRRSALEDLAALMYRRGYRAEELIVFHHIGEIQAIYLEGENIAEPRWIMTDSTRIYLGARQPVWEARLRLRRLWRRLCGSPAWRLDQIEVKEFPIE